MFLSMEQPMAQLAARICAIDGAARFGRIMDRPARVKPTDWHGRAELDRIRETCERIATVPLCIDDTSSMSLPYIRSRLVRQAAAMERAGRPLEYVALDFIQRARMPSADNRAQGVSLFCAGLADICRDMGIAMLALSQINREADKRATMRVTMGDMKDSGGIEENADVILGIWRPGRGDNAMPDETTTISRIKNKFGPQGRWDLEWEGHYLRVSGRPERSTAQSTREGWR